jgi:hypothetical protein
MSIFDLIFILCFLASVVTFIAGVIMMIRGRWQTLVRILGLYGMCAASYFAVDMAIAYLRPQRVIAIATPWCFDEWCLAVTKATHSAGGDAQTYNIDLELSSQTRGRAQRANGAWVYLIDDVGRRYAPESNSSDVPLDTLLQPGESIQVSRRFTVPANVREVGLVTGHGGPYCGAMSVLIVGSAGCVFNKPTMIRLQ